MAERPYGGAVLDDLDDDDIDMLHALGRHSSAHRLEDFLAQGAPLWVVCPSHPSAWLRARSEGRIVFSSHGFPDNVVLKACGSRSELRCPSCATLYRGDARHLVRAGLEGGKGVDESVANHPAVFLTLTAPGFGVGAPGDPRRAHVTRGVAEVTVRTVARSPVTSDTPATTRSSGHRCAPLLRLRRRRAPQCAQRRAVAPHHHLRRPQLARSLGLSRTECAKVLRLEHAKVAEFQRRGLVHFHAVIRADGPDGSAPPSMRAALARACLAAAAQRRGHPPGGTARWGSELDVQVLARDGRLPASPPTWPSTPPRSRPCTPDSSPASSLNRIWSAVASRRICSTWWRRPGARVPIPSSAPSVCGATPTISATRATSSPSRGGTRPPSGPSVMPGPSGTDRRDDEAERVREDHQTAEGSRTWLGQQRRGPLRRRPGPTAGRGQEGGGLRMAHPERVSPRSEGKPPQAVRQASGHPDPSMGGSSASLLGRGARPLATAAPVVPGHEGLKQSRDGVSFGRIEDNDSKRVRRLEGGEQFSRRNVGVRHGWR